ncbi:MAG: hypothetical protein EBQ49_01660, partial [Verrucomicrobia bacterium]|nr:hypothetical protein [Verrucomicrobiota bacterium]
MNQGIHTIDLLLWLLGPVKRVSATMGLVAHKNIEVEDIATGWIEFTNGARATIAGTTTCWSQNGLPLRFVSTELQVQPSYMTIN